MPPVPAPMPAVSPDTLTVNGNPDCIERIPESWRSPKIVEATPIFLRTGRSYKKVLMKRCSLWNEARLRSAARLKESWGGEFSFPFTPPALRNCGAFVIAFDQV